MSAEVKHTTFTLSVLPSRMLHINLYVNRSIPQRVRDLLNVISSSRETRPTSLIINFRYFMTVAHFLLQNLDVDHISELRLVHIITFCPELYTLYIYI